MPYGRNWLVEHPIVSRASRGRAMIDHQHPTGIEYLRCELLDRMDAQPFDDWSPALLRTLIAIFDLNGVTPASAQHGFRPYIVR